MLKTITLSEWINMPNPMPLLDARSEGEYEQGHIKGAISFPVLNNEERKLVGTCYKQKGSDQAVLLGYKLVGPKFEAYLKEAFKRFPKGAIAVHCWRGGLRSRIMGNLLDSAGYEVYQIKGGYKTYRELVLQYLERDFEFKVFTGYTGSGKTVLLEKMETEGFQVLNLERLANHRGSAFGNLGLPEQPTQEQFENSLYEVLWRFDPKRPIYTEDESRKIGRVVLPLKIYEAVRNAPLTFLDYAFENRLNHILETYGRFEPKELIPPTEKLKKRMGDKENRAALVSLEAGDIATWAAMVLKHYDKQYTYSMTLKDKSKISYTKEEFDVLIQNLKF